MPTRPSKNVRPVYLEFPPELFERIENYAESLGTTVKAIVIEAAERHLRHPPTRTPEPFPADEAPLPPPPPKKARAKKG